MSESYEERLAKETEVAETQPMARFTEVLDEAGHNHGPARQCSRQYPHPSHDFTSFDFGPAKCEGIKV